MAKIGWIIMTFLAATLVYGCDFGDNLHDNKHEGEPEPETPRIGEIEFTYVPGHRSITVTWKQCENASEYQVLKSREVQDEYVSEGVYVSEITEFVDDNVDQNGRYRYIIKPVTAGEMIGYTSEPKEIFIGICGIVLGSKTGMPIEGARVTLNEADEAAYSKAYEPIYTDSKGCFAIPNSEYGAFSLLVSRQDEMDRDIYVTEEVSVHVASGEYQPITIQLRPIPIDVSTVSGRFKSPAYIAFTRDGRRVYVTNEHGKSVLRLDKPHDLIQVRYRPYGIVANPERDEIYVANRWSDSISIINTRLDEAESVESGRIGQSPTHMAISPDGDMLYVTLSGDNAIGTMGLSQRDIGVPIPLGQNNRIYPHGIVITPDGKFLYVANKDEGTISVIHTGLRKEIDTRYVYGEPMDVAISMDGQEIYVSIDDTPGRLVVMSTSEPRDVIDEEVIGTDPRGLAVHEDIVYVVVSGENKVKMYDARRRIMVNRTIDVGFGPMGIATNGEVFYVTNWLSHDVSMLRYP